MNAERKAEPVFPWNELIALIRERFMQTGSLELDESKTNFIWHGELLSRAEIAEVISTKITATAPRTQQALALILDEYRRARHTGAQERVEALERGRIDDYALRQFLKSMVIGDLSSKEFGSVAHYMKRFQWGFKNKVMGREALWPICPVFYSDGGAGKTYNINRLCEPFEEYKITVTMQDLVDDSFNKKMLSRSRLVFLDEMQGAQKRLEGPIKELMTAKHIGGRMIRQSEAFKTVNRLSFIAASNYPPPFRFQDPNILRRLGPIPIESDPTKLTPERLKERDQIPIDEIWRAVSYRDVNPHETVEREVLVYINQRNKSWMDDENPFAQFARYRLEYCQEVNTPLREIRDAFKAQCREDEIPIPRPLNQDVLHRELNAVGIRVTKSKRKYICPDHHLQSPDADP